MSTFPPAAGAQSAAGPRGWLRNPVAPSATISGVLFDVDGTLYDQGRLRAFMAAELAAAPLWTGAGARHRWRVLRAYRKAQERLRFDCAASASLAADQIREAAVAGGVSEALAARWVEEWMCLRPLKYLRYCTPRRLSEFLAFLVARGITLGVLSDYDPRRKLAALGVADRFDVVVCSTDPPVNALKPHPRPFLHGCALMGLEPSDVLYVGDRPEVDAAGARAAGMPCAIVGQPRRFTGGNGCLVCPTLEQLFHVFHDSD